MRGGLSPGTIQIFRAFSILRTYEAAEKAQRCPVQKDVHWHDATSTFHSEYEPEYSHKK
jgi:hypothetical protein